MQQQFVVPQFLDVEPKIIGPVTGRQFLILMATSLLIFILYSLSPSIILAVILNLPVLLFGLALAFYRPNGVAMHFFLLNMLQTLRKPGIRIWDKTLSDSDIRTIMKKAEEPVIEPEYIPRKPPLEYSRLSELTLVVNTGGKYESESEDNLDLSTRQSYGKKDSTK